MKGLMDKPVLYLSKYIIDNKKDYYRLLQEVRTRSNWEEWVLYINRALEVTASETIEKVHQINNLFYSTMELLKKEKPKVYSKELLELLFVQPYCRIEVVMEQLGVSRPTASRYLNELTEAGILNTRQIWKETLFIHHALFDILKE
jgi:Fic family protein